MMTDDIYYQYIPKFKHVVKSPTTENVKEKTKNNVTDNVGSENYSEWSDLFTKSYNLMRNNISSKCYTEMR